MSASTVRMTSTSPSSTQRDGDTDSEASRPVSPRLPSSSEASTLSTESITSTASASSATASTESPEISRLEIHPGKAVHFDSTTPVQRRHSRATPPLPQPLEPSHAPPQKWARGEGFWRSFAAMCIPLLLSALEGSVTNTALPTISHALDLGTNFSWVATAFLLASTIFQPLYSQLGDMWGRKYPMMVAVSVFAVGSAICGAANSGSVLIFGRTVQGLGTGGIDLFAEMILCDIVPLRKRGPYLAIKHMVFATGTTLGPLLGGIFAERGWRWCFLINIPVCVVAIVVMFFWLKVGGGIKRRDVRLLDELKKVDFWGTTLLTSSVIMVLVALSTGGAPRPWSHPAVVVPLIFGILGFAAFPFFERSRWCTHPMMPPRIFSNRTSKIAYTLTVLHGFITYGFQFYLPPFFQAVKGSSPTKSGLEVLPCTLIVVVLAAVGGPLLSHFGKYKAIHIGGFAAMTLGLGLCIMLEKSTPVGAWVMFELIVAAGLGIVISSMLVAVQVKLPDSTNGASSGTWAFLRGTGSLFGVAIPGAVFNVRFAQLLPSISNADARAKLAHGQAYQRAASAFVGSFGSVVEKEIIHSFTESLKCVWIVFTMVAAGGFALTFWEKEYKMRKDLDTLYGLKASKKTENSSAPNSGTTTPLRQSVDRVRELDLSQIV
ncbi:major facilitator superfamily domain-containing protein [Massariosphaeria phaeospora]|uniref:Major facilitator superfamily domain-containing protein n=1 Tax=Massariosphaeria phaeospora TaxID=100035 RepID=A0A7C8MM07_9PLEO|nr:major facilitator superfamily domain-containing protein [Massariosphaeria phaeospora]